MKKKKNEGKFSSTYTCAYDDDGFSMTVFNGIIYEWQMVELA